MCIHYALSCSDRFRAIKCIRSKRIVICLFFVFGQTNKTHCQSVAAARHPLRSLINNETLYVLNYVISPSHSCPLFHPELCAFVPPQIAATYTHTLTHRGAHLTHSTLVRVSVVWLTRLCMLHEAGELSSIIQICSNILRLPYIVLPWYVYVHVTVVTVAERDSMWHIVGNWLIRTNLPSYYYYQFAFMRWRETAKPTRRM